MDFDAAHREAQPSAQGPQNKVLWQAILIPVRGPVRVPDNIAGPRAVIISSHTGERPVTIRATLR